MKEIVRTDISEKKEFTFDGELLKMKECYDAEKHIYIYERYNRDGRLYAYEVVKGKKQRKSTSSEEFIFCYPSSEMFGKGYGYFVAKNKAYGERGIYYYAQKLAQ